MPLISIVVVTWNSQDVLGGCVSSLLSLVTPESFELVLVDNGSEDPGYLQEFERLTNVRVVRNGTNLGFSRAVNIGLAQASGDYHLILNPDMIFTSNPFTRLIEELRKDPKIGVIAPLLHGSDGVPQIRDFYPRLPSLLQLLVYRSVLSVIPPLPRLTIRYFHARIGKRGVHFVDQIPGAFLFYHKDLFGGLPALNEAYFIWMEDVDFCLKVHRKGLKVAVVADESITHIGGTSFRRWDVPRKRLMFTRSYLTFIRLSYGYARFLAHAGVMILNALASVPLFPLFHRVKRTPREIVDRMILEMRMVPFILGLVIGKKQDHI